MIDKALLFRLHDDENVAAQEQIVNQLTMSPDGRLRASPQTSANNTEMSLIPREPTAQFSFTVLLRKCYNHLEQLRYKLQLQTYAQCTNNEWLLVAIFMDKILFFIYFIIVFFSLITIFKWKISKTPFFRLCFSDNLTYLKKIYNSI